MRKFILLSIFSILFTGCGKIDFMSHFDQMSSKLEFISFSANFSTETTDIECNASFSPSMGQTITRAGFCWAEGDVTPLLNAQGVFSVICLENLKFGVDVNSDGMDDFPGATSGKYPKAFSMSASLDVTIGLTYSIRPYVILNGVNVVYGDVILVNTY